MGRGEGEGGLGGGGGERCPRVPLILSPPPPLYTASKVSTSTKVPHLIIKNAFYIMDGQRGGEGRGERCDKSGSALPYEKKILKLYLHSCSAVWLPNMGKNGHNKLGKVKIRQNKVV